MWLILFDLAQKTICKTYPSTLASEFCSQSAISTSTKNPRIHFKSIRNCKNGSKPPAKTWRWSSKTSSSSKMSCAGCPGTTLEFPWSETKTGKTPFRKPGGFGVFYSPWSLGKFVLKPLVTRGTPILGNPHWKVESLYIRSPLNPFRMASKMSTD